MQSNPQKQSVQPVDLKVDAAKEGSLSVNPAMVANAGEEIAMNNPAQVEIALDVAAAYRNGHFLLHLALLLQPHPRRGNEPPRATSVKGNKKLVHLSEEAVALLREIKSNRPLSIDGWQTVKPIMLAAVGWEVSRLPTPPAQRLWAADPEFLKAAKESATKSPPSQI